MIEKMTETEFEVADIIWQQEPILSTKLVAICIEKFNWKKSTAYTILKRIENKGIIVNENGVIKSLIKKDEWETYESEKFINETFSGSLPKFLTAFSRGSRLTKKEIEELKKLIEQQEG